MDNTPIRQIHLDFHTSPYINNIGSDFDRQKFVETLSKVKAESVTLFAKCHHGMFYYPTKLGTMHPGLSFDLLGEQVAVCKENNIRVIIYTCVGWNEDTANRHPEWQQVNTDGVLGLKKPFDCSFYSWQFLCVNNPDYIELLKAELKEIYDCYHPAGFFLDIVNSNGCVCHHCREEMWEIGLDPENPKDVTKHDRMNEIRFCEIFYSFVKSLNPDLLVTFNNSAYVPDLEDEPEFSTSQKRKSFSYIDIESLPSDQWGYTHFPIAINYLNKYDYRLTMMNGKFHLAWGDFGSIRNENALEYECFRGLANGTAVIVGDQLQPNGQLEPAVYQRLAPIFASIEEKEPWLKNTRKRAEVGVYCTNRVLEWDDRKNFAQEGVYRMLTECQIPFDFISFDDEIDKYSLVILPDWIRLPKQAAEKLNIYIRHGGKVLASNLSGLKTDEDQFALDCFGAEYLSPSDYETRYFRLSSEQFAEIPAMDHVSYSRGQKVRAIDDAKVLAEIIPPYFNRTNRMFCSHRQTPSTGKSNGYPAIIRTASSIYIACPFFTDYGYYGYRVYKEVIRNCIEQLVERPLVKADLSSITELTIRENDKGIVVHTLNYCIQRKCKMLDVIEEKFELRDKTIAVKTEFQPSAVKMVPDGTPLSFVYLDGYVRFTVPVLSGHNMIFIEK